MKLDFMIIGIALIGMGYYLLTIDPYSILLVLSAFGAFYAGAWSLIFAYVFDESPKNKKEGGVNGNIYEKV